MGSYELVKMIKLMEGFMNKKVSMFLLMTIFAVISLSGAKDINGFKPLEKNKKDINVILPDLNSENWEKRYLALRKLHNYSNSEYLNDNELRIKLTQLLKFEIDSREKYIFEKISKGWKKTMAINEFHKMNHHEGRYIQYINELFNLVIKYKDTETIPLLLDCIGYYGSDEVSYYSIIYFGKNGLDELRRIIQNDNEKRKSLAIQTLAIWINDSLNERNNDPERGELRSELKLNSPEIKSIKDELISVLQTKNTNQIYFINWSLAAIARNTNDINEKKELKKIIKKSLVDKIGYIRTEAAKYIGEIGDSSDIPDLEKMLGDSYLDPSTEKLRQKQIEKSGKTTLKQVYPVREAIREAILKIQSRFDQK